MSAPAPFPKNAPPAPPGRPWRVTAYRGHWYWGSLLPTRCFVVGDFRHYWQANAVSWIWHYVFRYGCNTWKHEGANRVSADERSV